jgi:ankyrin repeat protein
MWAIAEGHAPVVSTLLEAGADVRAHSEAGYTPLTFAARDGNLAFGEQLVAKGADVNAVAADGMSVLHVATVRGQVAFANFLLDNGATPNATGPGFTPLHWAVGRWDTITSKDYQVGRDEWRVMSGIPESEKLAFVRNLITHGADVNARATKSPPRLGFGRSSRVFDSAAEAGGTPYYFAAMGGEAEVMRLLVANGADPALASNDGTTALIAAAGVVYLATENDVPEARYLAAATVALEFGADINAANSAGNTALHATAWSGLISVTKLLLDHGARMDLKNKVGETPLKVAEGTFISQQVWFQRDVAALLRSHNAPR